LFVKRDSSSSMVNVDIHYLIFANSVFVYLPPFVVFHKLFCVEEIFQK
jgi:hypothetical protein